MKQVHAVQPSTSTAEESDIRKWFASMDERWTKAQALRAEELKAKAQVGNPYEATEDETEAEKHLREIIHEGFLRVNAVFRRERNEEAALEFYFRFVMPDPHLAAPYLDLKGEIWALPRTTGAGDNERLSGPLLRAVHESHTEEEQVEKLGAAIRLDFINAVRAGDFEYVTALFTKIDDINDPDWRLMASCDPEYRKWILFSGPIGPHLLRPGNDVFRGGERHIPHHADMSQHLKGGEQLKPDEPSRLLDESASRLLDESARLFEAWFNRMESALAAVYVVERKEAHITSEAVHALGEVVRSSLENAVDMNDEGWVRELYFRCLSDQCWFTAVLPLGSDKGDKTETAQDKLLRSANANRDNATLKTLGKMRREALLLKVREGDLAGVYYIFDALFDAGEETKSGTRTTFVDGEDSEWCEAARHDPAYQIWLGKSAQHTAA